MAEQKKPNTSGNTRGLKEDEIIARLVPDPAAPPDVTAMAGFLGRSARPASWRLYQTLDLKDYVEIAEDDIVQSQSLKSDLQPLGGTVVWIKSGARLRYTQSESRLAETEFMQGDITRQFLAGTGPEGLSGWGGGAVLRYTLNSCPWTGNSCIIKWCYLPPKTRVYPNCNIMD